MIDPFDPDYEEGFKEVSIRLARHKRALAKLIVASKKALEGFGNAHEDNPTWWLYGEDLKNTIEEVQHELENG